ncbi:MAG TPA: exodeoxyribonuclease III [Myxococcota bacterium]|nr:exodeoxyribonuclease III [Myxococcota bacterium]
MRIVTWNINSLNARKDLAAAFLDEVKPDVLALQELKLETDKVPREVFESRGFHVAIHGQKSWNGVLIASRLPQTDVVTGLDGDAGESRFIAATVDGIRFVNLYCPQGQNVESEKFAYKLAFYDALIAKLGEVAKTAPNLVVLGDLNVAPEPDDVWDVSKFEGIPSYHPLEHQRWKRLLEVGLSDLVKPRVPSGTFSFWDYRGGDFRFNHGMRIDHVLGTAPVAGRVASAGVLRDWRKKRGEITPSDHAPVFVELAASGSPS